MSDFAKELHQASLFKKLVTNMRYWQRQYFQHKSSDALNNAKYGEKVVDAVIDHGYELNDNLSVKQQSEQTELFQDGENE